MHAVIPKPWIALNPRLLGQNIIVLPLQITANLPKAGLIIHTITEARRIHNRQADPRALLIELQLHRHGLDLDRGLARRRVGAIVHVCRFIGVEVGEDVLFAEGVDEGGAPSSRGAADHQAELDALLHVLLAPQLRAGD